MNKTTKVRYSGILAKPMVRHRAYTLAKALAEEKPTKEEEQAINEKNTAQLRERVLALYAHYGIDPKKPDANLALLLALTEAHVPGFRWKEPGARGKGRPSKWKTFKGIDLYADVKFLVSKGKSARNACRILATSARYKERYKDESWENLYRRYQEAAHTVPSYVRIFSDIVERERAAGKTVDQWLIESFALREKS